MTHSSSRDSGRWWLPLAYSTGPLLSVVPVTVVISTASAGAKAEPVRVAVVVASDTRGNIACTSRPPHEFVSHFRKPHPARDERRGHRELHAEFRLEARLRTAVAQHQQLRLAGRDMDARDLVGREVVTLDQIERGVDRAVGRVTDRIALDVEALTRRCATPSPRRSKARSSSALPSGDNAASKPGGCSSASSDAVSPACGQPRGDHARLRRAADLEGLGHGAEIGDQAGGHRGGDGHGASPVRSASRPRNLAQAAAAATVPSTRSDASPCDAAASARAPQFGPHFVARDIGRRASRRRLSRSPRPGRGSPERALRSDGRREPRRRSRARARRRH